MAHQATAPERTGGPRLRKGERTRRQLVEVAATLFAERGYAATTYDDLVAASGLSRGGFYFHFRTKEDLAMAVIDHKQRFWETGLRSRLDAIEDPSGRFAAFGPALTQMHIEDPSGWNLVMLTSEMARVPGLAEQARSVSRRWVEYLADIVADAQSAGGIRPDVDPANLAATLMGSFSGLRQMSNRYPTDDHHGLLDQYATTWQTIVTRGLKPAPGDDGPGGTTGVSGTSADLDAVASGPGRR